MGGCVRPERPIINLIVGIIIGIIVGIIVVVPLAQHEVPGVLASSPAEEIMAVSAGREPAIVAAKDVLPTTILADLTASRISSSSGLVLEIVVVAVDLQSLLELC